MSTRKRLIPCFLLLVLLVGCAHNVVLRPGALNAFDQAAYESLMMAQSSITQAKALVPQFPAMKAPLNKVIAGYNEALAAYKAYHAAGTGDTAALDKAIADVVAQTVALLGQMGVKL